MGQGWSMRAYKNGDEEGMFELDRAVYGQTLDRDRWMSRWQWKYRRNPAGAPVIWFAESDGKLVGQYPVNPVKMKVGNEVLTGSQMVELMTHPDYQRRGIFLALARQALDDAGGKGMEVTYGFPNEPAFPGHIKSGYSDVGAQGIWIRPLNLANILREYVSNAFLLRTCSLILNLIMKLLYSARKAPPVNGLKITRVSSFDERIDRLWAKVSNDHEIIVIRDKEYLNWRYIDVPDADYAIYVAEKEGQVLGYTVLRCEKQPALVFGRIFDLVVPVGQESVAHALILKAVEFFGEEKADLVIYRMIGGKGYRKALRRCGLINSRFAGRAARFIAHANTPRISEAFLRNPGHWFVQTGDSDTL